jgi:hypothetical protein
MNFLYEPGITANAAINSCKSVDHCGLGETEFHRMISLERRRTNRSKRSFLLMLVEMNKTSVSAESRTCLQRIFSAMLRITRETDITGWYKENSVVGVMFTEITFDNQSSIPKNMLNRVHEILTRNLSTQQLLQVSIQLQLLPEPKKDAVVVRESFSPIYVKFPISTATAESAL